MSDIQNIETSGSDNSNTQNVEIALDVLQAVEDAQLFIAYIAWDEEIQIDEEILRVLIDAKYLVQEGKWSAKVEHDFWVNYDKLSGQVAPVTIESIKSSMPWIGKDHPQKSRKTPAFMAVRRYRWMAVGTLSLLLSLQIYWFIGMDLTQNLTNIFNERALVDDQIEKLKNVDTVTKNALVNQNGRSLDQLEEASAIWNQRLDANYELLRHWNRVWQINQQFDSKITEYVTYKYDGKAKKIQTRLGEKITKEDLDNKITTTKAIGETLTEKEITEQLRQLNLKKELDKARNRFFLNQLSADFVLRALQFYFLPLVYGLLGAVIYVLRTLSLEIKNVVYSRDSEVGYRLRLSLGALAGLIIGWFLNSGSSGVASLSPMAVSFLMGYNVEIFFAIMDKFINSIKTSIQGKDSKDSSVKSVPPAAPTKKAA